MEKKIAAIKFSLGFMVNNIQQQKCGQLKKSRE